MSRCWAIGVRSTPSSITASLWNAGVASVQVAHVPWVVFAGAFALTESFPVHFEHRRESISMSLSTIPLVVGLYATGPIGIVAARLVGSAVALVLRRRQLSLKLAVNLSAFWMETAVAVGVFRLLHHGADVGSGSWLAAFGAAKDVIDRCAWLGFDEGSEMPRYCSMRKRARPAGSDLDKVVSTH